MLIQPYYPPSTLLGTIWRNSGHSKSILQSHFYFSQNRPPFQDPLLDYKSRLIGTKLPCALRKWTLVQNYIGPPCAQWCTMQVGGAQRSSVLHKAVLDPKGGAQRSSPKPIRDRQIDRCYQAYYPTATQSIIICLCVGVDQNIDKGPVWKSHVICPYAERPNALQYWTTFLAVLYFSTINPFGANNED